jgi:hypothetical protein
MSVSPLGITYGASLPSGDGASPCTGHSYLSQTGRLSSYPHAVNRVTWLAGLAVVALRSVDHAVPVPIASCTARGTWGVALS